MAWCHLPISSENIQKKRCFDFIYSASVPRQREKHRKKKPIVNCASLKNNTSIRNKRHLVLVIGGGLLD